MDGIGSRSILVLIKKPMVPAVCKAHACQLILGSLYESMAPQSTEQLMAIR